MNRFEHCQLIYWVNTHSFPLCLMGPSGKKSWCVRQGTDWMCSLSFFLLVLLYFKIAVSTPFQGMFAWTSLKEFLELNQAQTAALSSSKENLLSVLVSVVWGSNRDLSTGLPCFNDPHFSHFWITARFFLQCFRNIPDISPQPSGFFSYILSIFVALLRTVTHAWCIQKTWTNGSPHLLPLLYVPSFSGW